MNKFIILFSTSVLLLCASQWANNAWLSNNIATQIQTLNTKHTEEINTQNIPATPIPTVNVENLSLRLEKVIAKQIQTALAQHIQALSTTQGIAGNKVANNTSVIEDAKGGNETHQDTTQETSQEAFSAAMDIATNASLNGNWGEDVNNQLSHYKGQMNDAQRNQIVSEYVQAFNEGFVKPGTTPPF